MSLDYPCSNIGILYYHLQHLAPDVIEKAICTAGEETMEEDEDYRKRELCFEINVCSSATPHQ